MGLRPEFLEKQLRAQSLYCFCQEIGPKTGIKGQFQRNINISNSPVAQRIRKASKKKKRKKIVCNLSL